VKITGQRLYKGKMRPLRVVRSRHATVAFFCSTPLPHLTIRGRLGVLRADICKLFVVWASVLLQTVGNCCKLFPSYIYVLGVIVDDWQKYARARNQIYHVSVLWRRMQNALPEKHRTRELLQLLDIIADVIKQAQEAFEAGQLMAVQIDRYEAVPLPGFEDYHEEMKKPRWDGET